MPTSLPIKGLLHLVIVYLVWGSTYLFIRVAVREGSGFPPFAMVASRILCAAAILFPLAWMLGHRLRVSRSELRLLAVSGLLLWLGGNGMVTWAERHADSGYAALVLGTTPIWAVIMEAIIDREIPSPLLILSLLVGFAGLGVLVWPVLQKGVSADLASTVALLIAAVIWPAGSLMLQRSPPKSTAVVVSAYQQFFGGLGLMVAMLLVAEPWPQPNTSAWIGWAYLVIAGSVISFTSYVIAVRTLPITVVTTYAYVNPVIAVLLGRVVLDERITSSTLLGMVLILASVAGVFRHRSTRFRASRPS
ncbi:MAG: EamA family transporter [Deltaproteobacteria bacterium]|nr:EamA family transporter [Deltaproteobacteria bacterium]